MDKVLRYFTTFIFFFSLLNALEVSAPLSSANGDSNIWSSQCKKKDFTACYLLGRAYFEGYDVLRNDTKALRFLNLACNNNIIESCIILYKNYKVNNLEFVKQLASKSCDDNKLESCEFLANVLLDSRATLNSKEMKDTYYLLSKVCKMQNDFKCAKLDEFIDYVIKNTDKNAYFDELKDLCKKKQNIQSMNNDLKIDFTHCGALGDLLDSKGQKDSARFYYNLACRSDKSYCYNAILDSILNP